MSKSRKLPWRGDPGPYDGSVSGITKLSTNANGKNNSKKPPDFDALKKR